MKFSFEDVKRELTDREAMILTVYGEARGEPVEGQLAVINTINNRSKNRAQTIKEVCFARLQFSCWNQNDPNFPILMELANQIIVDRIPDNKAFNQIAYLTEGILSNRLSDNSRGSDHYMTTDLFQSDKRPSWARNPKRQIEIGNHTFLII